MRHLSLKASLVFLGLMACKPDVGAPPSLIQGPTILAIRGEPAEAKQGAVVSYEALVVDPNGRMAVPEAPVKTGVTWATCDQPKPPIENNSVSVKCLDLDALPGVPGPTPSTFKAPIPDEACATFGPTPPPSEPGEPPIRARDQDVTGGYYVPIRASVVVPETQRRPGMATEDSIISFTHQRVSCGIAKVGQGPYLEYIANYKLNTNPKIAGLKLSLDGTELLDIPAKQAGVAPIAIKPGSEITLYAGWTVESRETYPAYDVIDRDLKYHPESLRVSWFATGGEFKHDVTGRGEEETEFFAENTWKANTEGLIHLWIVLHDSRGGTDFESYELEVIP